VADDPRRAKRRQWKRAWPRGGLDLAAAKIEGFDAWPSARKPLSDREFFRAFGLGPAPSMRPLRIVLGATPVCSN